MDKPSKNTVVIIVNELRKSILLLTLTLVLASLAFYYFSTPLLNFLQDHLEQKLAFFTIAGPFLAHVKISLALALFTFMPAIIYCFWRALAKPFKLSRLNVFWFVVFTCLLFYAGTAFCYLLTLPYGVKFLLGFQSEQLRAVISINRFVSFVSIFILAFGFIFELPIFMIFLAKTGLIARKTFENNRRYALLVISIVAALLTPTPDVVNMLLMGGPLYILYEAGILVLKFLRIP
ncbi:MAG: twin-arginine translocase subunit TatC [Desulfobulbaceae bacterium]|nr:twin-arginine translocase subunit TatC [Desulfobulbaceae bacterium]HIJ78186.1 twin-arginine translocase subunit TatC [Deltaproteobacteria bacterium]